MDNARSHTRAYNCTRTWILAGRRRSFVLPDTSPPLSSQLTLFSFLFTSPCFPLKLFVPPGASNSCKEARAEILSCHKDTDLKKVTHWEHVNMAHWYFLFIFILFSRHPPCSDILHKITHQYLVRSYRKRWKLNKNHWHSPYRAWFEIHLWIFWPGSASYADKFNW